MRHSRNSDAMICLKEDDYCSVNVAHRRNKLNETRSSKYDYEHFDNLCYSFRTRNIYFYVNERFRRGPLEKNVDVSNKSDKSDKKNRRLYEFLETLTGDKKTMYVHKY